MAGNKYHINPETGRPNQCTATVRGCKYAVNNLIPEHYDSKEEAQAAYEKSMNEESGQTTALSKTKETVKRKPNIGVHATHCCSDHGCKYGNDECPVVNGQVSAEYPCEICQEEEPVDRGYRKLLKSGSYISEETYKKIYHALNNAMNSGDGRTIDLSDYSNSIEYDDGEWYYPTPDEDYHRSDISYTTNPFFVVKSEIDFTRETILNNSILDEDYDLYTISDKGLEKLREAGFFDRYSYEARIEKHYYGDEFRGWTIDKDVREKTVEILIEEAIYQSHQ